MGNCFDINFALVWLLITETITKMNTVMLFSDDHVLIAGVKQILGECKVGVFCGSADTIQGLQQAASGQVPEIVLVDFGPEGSFSIISDIRDSCPGSKIVLWTRYMPDEL